MTITQPLRRKIADRARWYRRQGTTNRQVREFIAQRIAWYGEFIH